jgi:hypothetical protein
MCRRANVSVGAKGKAAPSPLEEAAAGVIVFVDKSGLRSKGCAG